MHVQGAVLDALLPPHCASCGAAGARWCAACQAAAPRLHPPLCPRCGDPTRGERTECGTCRAHPPAFDRAAAWGAYDGTLQAAIRRYKFRRDFGLAEVFAARMAEAVRERGWTVDAALPVPLGRERQRERGYNQAALLARPLAAALGCRYAGRMLRRARETRPQVGLSVAERRRNVAGAFAVRERPPTGARLLVVDDVMTTGATLSDAARALKEAGAGEVYAVALARAV
jgi:ComF family protein